MRRPDRSTSRRTRRIATALYAASPGGQVHLRDRRTGQTTQMGDVTTDPSALAISADRSWIAFPVQRMRARTIQMYSVQWGSLRVQCPGNFCDQPALSTTGGYHAFVSHASPTNSGQRVLVDGEQGGQALVADLSHGEASRPSISGDGDLVAYQNGLTKDVHLWNRATGTAAGPLEGPGKDATLVQLSDDGRNGRLRIRCRHVRP
ncbi:hypothetical protein GCM10010329_36880 [Streptomyces spiroverticillatus]|uniref:WD40 repeat domain-containing protein n=1 Tax=Streptomyces finlayi TaxID=67296 RepID=A0A919CAP2_9ACTN|nr:hypothetical protein [Streptomyces finlayi]GHA10712.1 hypothetical protein GCM10010329_36880 [Streptomyces spiroverticillatus]GHC95444.1 hypothetical protein GCM10010334_34720 [Streptomyces finlayi]